jgi:hypothetical protein
VSVGPAGSIFPAALLSLMVMQLGASEAARMAGLPLAGKKAQGARKPVATA